MRIAGMQTESVPHDGGVPYPTELSTFCPTEARPMTMCRRKRRRSGGHQLEMATG